MTEPDLTPSSAVTMSDVAKEAGVSVMTVSNVVNSRAERVGPDTRQRVLAAIERLGYRVNVTARDLRRGRTGVIALAVPDFAATYYGELAARLSDELAKVGLRLVLERTGGVLQNELDTLATSHLSAYDGLVLGLAEGDATDVEKQHPTAPLVLIGERTTSPHYDQVMMDNVAGARRAVRHLFATGSQRIALIGGTLDGPASMPALRTLGYREAHAQQKVALDVELIVPCGATMADGELAVQRMLAAGIQFDAVFGVTDAVAVGALRALAVAGLKVPADVQVVGWDATEAGRFTVPSLTTVDPDNDALSMAIARLLVARIEADRHSDAATRVEPQLVVPTAHLLERESTRPRSVKVSGR